jgi:hypothetical protein
MLYRDVWAREKDRETRESYERYLMRSASSKPNVAEGNRTLQ